jgi:2'-5' RNA ligase
MRLFVAVNIPAAVRDAIYGDAEPLRVVRSVKWVDAPLLHVTLKFLGEQPDDVVPNLTDALRTAASRHRELDVATTEWGAFPNFRRPRVVWVGMTGEPQLRALASDIDETFAALGIPAESRPFKAHLTLGRAKGEMRPADTRAFAEAAARPRASRGFAVRTVDLMRSELGGGGPRYSVLAAVPLHARGA